MQLEPGQYSERELEAITRRVRRSHVRTRSREIRAHYRLLYLSNRNELEDCLPGHQARHRAACLSTPLRGRTSRREKLADLKHVSMKALTAGLGGVRQSPATIGVLELIVRRPRTDVREVVEVAELDVIGGLVGDG